MCLLLTVKFLLSWLESFCYKIDSPVANSMNFFAQSRKLHTKQPRSATSEVETLGFETFQGASGPERTLGTNRKGTRGWKTNVIAKRIHGCQSFPQLNKTGLKDDSDPVDVVKRFPKTDEKIIAVATTYFRKWEEMIWRKKPLKILGTTNAKNRNVGLVRETTNFAACSS